MANKLQFSDEEQDDNVATEAVDDAVRLSEMSQVKRKRAPESKKPQSQQKKLNQKKYAKAKREADSKAKASETVSKAAVKAAERAKKIASFAYQHKTALIIGGIVLLLVMMLMSMVSSCAMMMQGVLGGFGVTTFQSDEAEMVSVEDTYTAMEEDLQYELDHYAALHPGYDEYHVSGTVLGHDPLVLTSILSAKYGEYTAGEVYATLMELFDKQYTILESVTADPDEYTVCSVTLESVAMEDLTAEFLTEEQQEMYEIYMVTGGNYADLFAGGEDE